MKEKQRRQTVKMIGAKVKQGNIRVAVSIPIEIDTKIRLLYRKQGDYSRITTAALTSYLQTKEAPEIKNQQA
jgi:hypothetical protein